MNPIIVLGAGLTSLGVTRAFGRRGIDVYICADRKGDAIFSKYCKRCFIDSRMRHDQKILKKLLRNLGKSLTRRGVVYPTSDLDVLNLSEVKHDLSDDFHFVVGEKKPVETLVNKSKFYKALDLHKIDHPVTYFPDDGTDVQRIGSKITYPVFIRPSITQLFNEILGVPEKGFIVHSTRELMRYYQLATKRGVEVMLQEIIPGPPKNSYQLEGYYDANQRPKALFARQRLRIWPPNFGNTTLCVSIPIVELAKEKKNVSRFVKAIGYQGLMSAEFKKDARDDALKLLEINARAWWHFWLSARCGADILLISYLDAIGEQTDYLEEYETGVKSLYFILDLMSSARMLVNRDADIREWISSLYGDIEFAFLQRDDLSPFIMDCKAKAFSLVKRELAIPKKAKTSI